MKKFLLIFIVSVFISMVSYGQTEAIYSITFTSVWSQDTHPHPSGALPSNAHWSRLVGAVHNSDVVFVEMGELASQGVENIAETGSNGVFFSEVNNAISTADALSIIEGGDLDSSEGQIFISEVLVNEDYPLITLLSMIAPSPDWMIAVNGVSVLDTNGDWLNQVELDVYPYDAGTDSGVDYTSPNNDTDPQEPISSLQGVAPFSNEIIGTLNINLVDILAVSNVEIKETVLLPNPATTRVTATNENSLKRVVFYNVLGTEVLRVEDINATSAQIDISDLSSGMYLVKAENETNNETVKRLVKL